MSISIGNSGMCFIKILNYGPGLAIDVKVCCNISKTIKKESNPKDIYIYNRIIAAEGPFEIATQHEGIFCIPPMLDFSKPITIKWNSITGKSYKEVWIPSGLRHDVFVRQTAISRIKWSFMQVYYYFQWPYIKIKTKYYFEYNYVKLKILERLEKEKNLGYDFIADESVRDDEEIKQILCRMEREGPINFDGDTAGIVDKGRDFLNKHIRRKS